VAYHYNFRALGRGFYDGVVPALERLKKDNIHCGVLSNAQFYTPIDLTLFVRDQSSGRYDDHHELFDLDLEFYSFEYGVAKPGLALFEKLFNVLYESHILPSQVVFVGNDLAADIRPARDAGMRTAFFAGDSRTAYLYELEETVVPDIVFTSYDQLPSRIAFHEEKQSQ
jgi:putative hydrolase of the HAD superfamily